MVVQGWQDKLYYGSSSHFKIINFELPDSKGMKFPLISNSPDCFIHLNSDWFPQNLRMSVPSKTIEENKSLILRSQNSKKHTSS